jgi:hypothetical protein
MRYAAIKFADIWKYAAIKFADIWKYAAIKFSDISKRQATIASCICRSLARVCLHTGVCIHPRLAACIET